MLMDRVSRVMLKAQAGTAHGGGRQGHVGGLARGADECGEIQEVSISRRFVARKQQPAGCAPGPVPVEVVGVVKGKLPGG
jgi:hypothetical protein